MKIKNWYIALMSFGFIVCLISFSNAGQLVYSTYLGGSDNDYGESIAVDIFGNAYITGYTSSFDFPCISGAFDTIYNTNYDIFVTKLNSSGSGLLYSTFLGGKSSDEAFGIDIDNDGNAYIIGYTMSSDFPVTLYAFETNYHDLGDVVVAKLNTSGSDLIYSTFLGGTNTDIGYSLAIDGERNAYITGFTRSTDFPTTLNAFDTIFNGSSGSQNGFITKLDSTGSNLIYSTFLGGQDNEEIRHIALDISNNAYVTGKTNSVDFPVTANAFDTSFNGYSAVFVTKLNPIGSALVYSTYLGGGNSFPVGNYGRAIAIDNDGNAYITGYTGSKDFPVTPNAFDTSYSGFADVFVTKLNPTGTTLIYSTFLGGVNFNFTGDDIGEDIAIDNSGNAYITGYTQSTNFPITSGALDTSYNNNDDAFLTVLNSTGNALLYSSYLGGSRFDYSYGIALDSSNNIYLTGYTDSTDFPIIPGAFDTILNDSYDIFVTKLKIPRPTSVEPDLWKFYNELEIIKP
jgi:hypothetical protein